MFLPVAAAMPGWLSAASLAGLRTVSVPLIVLGISAIYLSDTLRAVRWALLMPEATRPPARTLIPSQFVGFAAVALFGRVADLTRPYLVARRTATPVALQVAVYSLERALDLAATAILFSVTLLFTPRTAPHHAIFVRAGLLASAATLFLLVLAAAIRAAGSQMADHVQHRLHRPSKGLATALAVRLRELQTGFSTLRSPAHILAALGWSLCIWTLIAVSYLCTAHSLPGTPQLTALGPAAVMLLMATSMGASLLQLPIVGWFTQVAALAAAFHALFRVPPAAASLCAVLTFAVNTLSVIPAGLWMARQRGLSMREAARPAVPATEV